MVTVYAELLKLALSEGDPSEASVDDLVAEALERRASLSLSGDAATRLAAAISYDSTLFRLCHRLGVDHDLTGPAAGPQARRRAERALASALPMLAVTLH